MSNYYSVYFSEQEPAFQLAIRVAYCVGLFAVTFLVYGLEKYILPTRGFLSLVPLAMGVLSTFLPYDTMRVLNYVAQGIIMVVVMGIYIYMASKTSGILRRNALYALVALVAFFSAIYLDSKASKVFFTGAGIRWVAYVIPPLLALGGIVGFYWATTRKVTDS